MIVATLPSEKRNKEPRVLFREIWDIMQIWLYTKCFAVLTQLLSCFDEGFIEMYLDCLISKVYYATTYLSMGIYIDCKKVEMNVIAFGKFSSVKSPSSFAARSS